jgi:outer membrane protein OmpA-like peptidoglycan-associated protein
MKNGLLIGQVLLAASFGGLTACAPKVPPADLVQARQVYDRASHGEAQKHSPADLHDAKTQLDRAEASYEKTGDSQETRDIAYVAVRKLERAEVLARTTVSKNTKDGVVDAMHADERKTVAQTSAELERTQSKLASERTAAAGTSAELGRTQGQLVEKDQSLAAEKLRREEAEKRSAQLTADLASFAKVTKEPRGMVITLSGSVLFASAKSELLPSAQAKLKEVAQALTKEDPLSKLVVEGHTDSQGGVPYNQDLSERRAEAVRAYLVSQGIAGDRVTSRGFGLSRSVADNGSAEGRANNRRVEIVVQPAS